MKRSQDGTIADVVAAVITELRNSGFDGLALELSDADDLNAAARALQRFEEVYPQQVEAARAA